MASKKLAATLGTGTLGASGAAGAAAWKLGAFDGKSLEIKGENDATHTLNVNGSDPSQIQNGLQSDSENETGSGIDKRAEGKGQYSSSNPPFAGATDYDIKAANSKSWKRENATNDGGIAIKIEEDDGNSWQCTIKGFVFGSGKDKSQIEEQVEQFVKEIKGDENKRKNFVKNCAEARLNTEKSEGKVSTIELEVDEGDEKAKLKDLDKLLSGNFLGLKRVVGEYKIDHNNAEDWGFSAETEGKDKKTVVKLKKTEDTDEVFCTIYVNLEGTSFNENNFDYDASNKIFRGKSYESELTQEEKLSNLEKRKFLFRNCLENKKTIEGMEAVSSGTQKWKIKDLEEKLLTKIYEKPGTTESQQAEEGKA